MVIQNWTSEVIFDKLDLSEHSVYLVKVKCFVRNIEHEAFLFTGFKSGSYCEVYNNSYDRPLELKEVYSITVIKALHTKY